MNPNHLSIVQHALGCDQYGLGSRYRNRYVVDDGVPEIMDLVAKGLMQDHGAQVGMGGMHYYSVTQEGIRAMEKESPKPPVLTRAQKRYRKWIDSGAADCGVEFGDYIRRKAA